MKHLTALLLATNLLLLNSCKKESTTSPVSNPTNTNTSTNPFFFKFSLNGLSYDLTSSQPEYVFGYPNEVGGYQDASTGLVPSVGLTLSWPVNDTVRESDVLGLAGKTLYFSDTIIQPQVTFDATLTTNTWYSEDTANTLYSIKITNVVFLKKDTTLGYALRTYVITGSGTAFMNNIDSTSVFSTGTFNFIVSRMDL